MQENDKAVLVYTTFPDQAAAEGTGGAIVQAGLAACVNIIPGMTSIYVWQGNLSRDSEVVMLVKTRASLAERVMAEITARHPYETPALLILPVEGGSEAFLGWIAAQSTGAPA